ncbi:MAG: DUF262 domain-containing protein [Capsulimonadaceae bacterium]
MAVQPRIKAKVASRRQRGDDLHPAFPAAIDGFTDVDEAGFEREFSQADDEIREPFDPTLIRIESKQSTINLLAARIRNGEINLAPDFQRRAGIWKDDAQSRLIESLLVKIPIPAFYVDASDENCWLVVDGLQRLTAIKRFVVDKTLKLNGLEFLDSVMGLTYDELPRTLRRRIDETEVTIFSIEKQTPPDVKFNIFKRINTGGLPLSSQEIRHALNQGPVTRLLEELAETPEFLQATSNGVSDERMGARECILRFLAFLLVPYTAVYRKDLDRYLNDAMKQLNSSTPGELEEIRSTFTSTMRLAYQIFGEHAFRKRRGYPRPPVNKALFETWSVNLAKLTRDQQQECVARAGQINSAFLSLMNDRRFEDSISQSTGDSARIDYRFKAVARIIDEVLK